MEPMIFPPTNFWVMRDVKNSKYKYCIIRIVGRVIESLTELRKGGIDHIGDKGKVLFHIHLQKLSGFYC